MDSTEAFESIARAAGFHDFDVSGNGCYSDDFLQHFYAGWEAREACRQALEGEVVAVINKSSTGDYEFFPAPGSASIPNGIHKLYTHPAKEAKGRIEADESAYGRIADPALDSGEPLAYAHEDENREDVITSKVKAFLSGLANHGGGFHRPVDIGERYTIPLYTHPASAVPEGWRKSLEKAIKMAEVFDDGGDGADDESARGVVSILNALLVAPTIADAPEDWKLVPIEPTAEMVEAAFDAFEVVKPMQYKDGNKARIAVWAAMIESSPKQEKGQ